MTESEYKVVVKLMVEKLEKCKDEIAEKDAEIERLKADNENYIKVAEMQQSLAMERAFEIKRLAERIEKRTTELDRLTIYFDKAVEEKLKTAKSEAIKEFAELLKEEVVHCVLFEDSKAEQEFIDITNNLVKEMVGAEYG